MTDKINPHACALPYKFYFISHSRFLSFLCNQLYISFGRVVVLAWLFFFLPNCAVIRIFLRKAAILFATHINRNIYSNMGFLLTKKGRVFSVRENVKFVPPSEWIRRSYLATVGPPWMARGLTAVNQPSPSMIVVYVVNLRAVDTCGHKCVCLMRLQYLCRGPQGS